MNETSILVRRPNLSQVYAVQHRVLLGAMLEITNEKPFVFGPRENPKVFKWAVGALSSLAPSVLLPDLINPRSGTP